MKAEINRAKDNRDIPYVELKISPDDEEDTPLYITFRKYPKRVFVGVEDYSDDMNTGVDMEDVWISPVVIVERTLKEVFDPKEAWLRAIKFAGAEYLADDYENFKDAVQEWLND